MTSATSDHEWTEYNELLALALRWKSHVSRLKAEAPAADRTWYGHDILANLWHLDKLLAQLPPDFPELFRPGNHVADIGGADGDLAFFLASVGLTVDLIDLPETNWNGLAGARALKERLGTTDVAIHEVDLDSQFALPSDRYDLTFFLGILYHLKNPFYALEKLARASRYCFLSTRIARQTADGSTRLENEPLAYLLHPEECNNDSTNYWIFSAPGLLRLADRCGWDVLASTREGDTKLSNPHDAEHDERMFLILKSRNF